MVVETLTLGPFETNCFIAVGKDNQALVIDPGSEADLIIDYLLQNGLTVAAYPLTHGHCDHVAAVAEVHARFPAPVGLHPLDAIWAFTERAAMRPYFDTPRSPGKIERAYAEGQSWTDAGLTYHVIETPGHTKGGVSFYFPEQKAVFSGDALFRGSVGRTDFPGGDARVLADSLRKLALLPDDTAVYPGHGPNTTIGFEKRNNFFMSRLN